MAAPSAVLDDVAGTTTTPTVFVDASICLVVGVILRAMRLTCVSVGAMPKAVLHIL